jgi:hypothetical protein
MWDNVMSFLADFGWVLGNIIFPFVNLVVLLTFPFLVRAVYANRAEINAMREEVEAHFNPHSPDGHLR